MTKVLIVEDEALIGMMLRKHLTSLNYEVIGAVNSGKQAIEHARLNPPDILLMDFKIKGALNGIETVQEVRKFLNIPVIFITGNTHLEGLKKMPYIKILGKPIDLNLLSAALRESAQTMAGSEL